MPKKFLRRTSKLHSKLGRKRKKKQVWRKPTGRDNKMKEKRKGRPKVVSVGYKKDKREKGKIEGKKVIRVMNFKDLKRLKKDMAIILGNIGNKKKIELVKYARENGIKILNVNTKKFMKKSEKKEVSDKKMTAEEARKIIESKMEEKSKEKNKWI